MRRSITSESTAARGSRPANGRDVLDLVDTLELESPILVGYDWGRPRCVRGRGPSLQPDRGVVAPGGCYIQDIAASAEPTTPLDEGRNWYQYYLHGQRGRAGLIRAN